MRKILILSLLLLTACTLDPEVSRVNQRFVKEGQLQVLSCQARKKYLLYCSGLTKNNLPVNWYCSDVYCGWFLPE